jgi:hypothetical protein
MHVCFSRGLLSFAQLAILLAALPFGRALACDLRLEGNPAAAWRAAARSVPAGAGGDCANMILRVERDEARLIFVTQDGRRAERALAGPQELAPSIAALNEAGPGELAADPTTSPQAHPAAAEAPPGRDMSVLGSLLGGARVGQYRLVSPIVSGSFLLRIRAWELGAMATWETGYYPNGAAKPAGRQNGAETTSLSFARRQPFNALTLLAGLRLGMAVRLRSPANSSFPPALAPLAGVLFVAPRLEGRIGPFVGFSLPRTALARLRFEAGVDLAFPRQDNASLPFSPWPFWAFALSVGMELGRT